MTLAVRLVHLAMSALLLGAMGKAPTPEPMPLACDTLRAVSVDELVGQSLEYQTTQDRKGTDLLLSMCTAMGNDGLPALTLLLRQDISKTGPQTALSQRQTMVAELADSFGYEPEVDFPDIGEAAVWVAEIKQLMVWYQTGRVMFIVTAGGATNRTHKEQAEQIAREIVARFN